MVLLLAREVSPTAPDVAGCCQSICSGARALSPAWSWQFAGNLLAQVRLLAESRVLC